MAKKDGNTALQWNRLMHAITLHLNIEWGVCVCARVYGHACVSVCMSICINIWGVRRIDHFSTRDYCSICTLSIIHLPIHLSPKDNYEGQHALICTVPHTHTHTHAHSKSSISINAYLYIVSQKAIYQAEVQYWSGGGSWPLQLAGCCTGPSSSSLNSIEATDVWSVLLSLQSTTWDGWDPTCEVLMLRRSSVRLFCHCGKIGFFSFLQKVRGEDRYQSCLQHVTVIFTALGITLLD